LEIVLLVYPIMLQDICTSQTESSSSYFKEFCSELLLTELALEAVEMPSLVGAFLELRSTNNIRSNIM
jgi:hypothetical protein